MMATLWSIIVLMIIVVSGVIAIALRNRASLNLTQQATNRACYQSQLDDLKSQYQEGSLLATQYEQDKIALQKDFSHQVLPQSTLTFHKHNILTFVVAVAVAVVSIALYEKLGASGALAKYATQQVKDQQAMSAIKKMGTPQEVIDKLKARLAEKPDQPQAWYLLGRLYFSQNQFDRAADAFEHAQRLVPQRADIAIQLAESYYLSVNHHNQLLAEPQLQKALQLAPNDPAILNLEAIMAYHAKDYAKALGIWQQLALEAPSGSDSAKALQQAIMQVQEKLNQQPAKALAVNLPAA